MKTMKLKDRTEVELTNEQAETIEQALVSGKTDFIRINGELYSPKSIDRIVKSTHTTVDTVTAWATPESQLPQGRICQVKYSIQNEINRIAKEEHPSEWTTLIRDKKWREKMRQKLLKLSKDWCDYKSNSCACYVSPSLKKTA